LSDFKGSVVVVDFWATWCGPCVASLPHLDALSAEMSDKGVRVLAINFRETDQQVKTFVEKKKLSLSVLMDRDGAVGKKYAVTGIPQTVVIGRDGVVRKVIVGFGGDDSEVRRAVEQAMK
jgi:thiol-disulfide isomerase/thioredoxin